MKRRLPDLCALCGNRAVDGWHCAGHLWASPKPKGGPSANGIEHVTKAHAYWIERFTPGQIMELASHLEPAA